MKSLPHGWKYPVDDGRRAGLIGSWTEPVVGLIFPKTAVHATSGRRLVDWVKSQPARRWNPDKTRWEVSSFASDPAEALIEAGFETYVNKLDMDFDDLFQPVAAVDPTASSKVQVWPRFCGYKRAQGLIGNLGQWVPGEGHWLVDPSLLPIPGVDMGDGVEDLVEASKKEDVTVRSGAAALAASPDLADVVHLDDVQAALAKVGDAPDWFGLDLFPFQRAGAIAVAAGHSLLSDEPGCGKGSPEWVRILTPTGWTTYGEVEVGDQVVGSDGRSTTVIGVYPRGELDVYRVTMSDGSSVVVDGDHLWSVETKNQRLKGSFGRVMSTRELAAEELHCEYGEDREYTYFIPMVEPIEFVDSGDLPVDPYLLGVILGDGHISSASVAVTTEDQFIVDQIVERCPEGVTAKRWADKGRRTPTYGLSSAGFGAKQAPNKVNHAMRALGLTGCRSHEKFIPPSYLFAPVADRVSLLRGLMDSDGHAGASAQFCTVSPQLRDDFIFLVQSLGGTARASSKSPTYSDRNGDKRTGRDAYQIRVTLNADLCPFLLPRKAEAWKQPWKYRPSRSIRSIEPAGREEVICIAVDAQDQLYVTEDCIVTHNTRAALASAAILDAHRVLVTCPPVVLTAWEQAAIESGLASVERYGSGLEDTSAGHDTSNVRESSPDPDSSLPQVVSIRPGRKEPDLPQRGVVVVSDSLIAARPELARRLREWRPDVLIGDEIHRAKSSKAARSKALRLLAAHADHVIGVSGTPMYATPVELTGPLAFTGHLDPVFGGWQKFMDTYCSQDRWGNWTPRKDMLAPLKEVLDSRVWVRRTKAQVLTELPPKVRSTKVVDVPLKDFRAAHNDVVEVVDEWLDTWFRDNAHPPSLDAIMDWAKGQVGLVTQLRRAAGVAKVPVATQIIEDWVWANSAPDSDGVMACTRPLVVWTHHREVTAAMAEAVPAVVPDAGVIDGSTSHSRRQTLVEQFQAGEIPVLVCSIHAAGVGITLTRSSDALFVETDWTPSLISQAEDRCHRFTATETVNVTTLVAAGTLDSHIQRVLANKIDVLDVVMEGADHHVVSDRNIADVADPPSQIIADIVDGRLRRRKGRSRSTAA